MAENALKIYFNQDSLCVSQCLSVCVYACVYVCVPCVCVCVWCLFVASSTDKPNEIQIQIQIERSSIKKECSKKKTIYILYGIYIGWYIVFYIYRKRESKKIKTLFIFCCFSTLLYFFLGGFSFFLYRSPKRRAKPKYHYQKLRITV